jgi:hypothetical protein
MTSFFQRRIAREQAAAFSTESVSFATAVKAVESGREFME